jgi:multiple antibiotic resistance protein
MLFVWFVIKKVNLVEKVLGKGGIYILRKFFGVILLAMSVKLIISNLIPLIS